MPVVTVHLRRCHHKMAQAVFKAEYARVPGMTLPWRLQTDLRVETVHLRRFYNNFASVRSSVTPPLPVPGMDTEAVLVETYEAGAHHFLAYELSEEQDIK